MNEQEKTAELTKIVSLVKRLIGTVDAKPGNLQAAGLIYSDIKHWYHAYKNKVRNGS